ncbi:MAG: YqiA/YcfP family alpha/beta fold hydrolase [Cyanobacteria bacterium P01_A01_bin.135]
MSRLVYLHGFASGPGSYKAQYLQQQLALRGRQLDIPDLNRGGFYDLTITRQIDQVTQLIAAPAQPVTLIGSSFGGLTAAWVAESCLQVERLVLLAPAFEFLVHLQAHLGGQYSRWQQEGQLPVYHHAYGQEVPLGYQFVTDLMQYSDSCLKRSLPTHIVHGERDAVIPPSASQRYQQGRAWVTLDLVDDDHSLTHALRDIWKQLQLTIA